MAPVEAINGAYQRILRQLVDSADQESLERCLYEASLLGRALVEAEIPPEDAVDMHHAAVKQVVVANPAALSAAQSENINKLLLELILSYGMQFRLHLEQQFNERIRFGMEQVQRLESLGTMAAGIAHDFNTIIGSIRGFAEIVQVEIPDDSIAGDCITQIQTACLRAQEIVSNLLSFARQQRPERLELLAVLPQVREALALVKSATTTELTFNLQADEHLEQMQLHCVPGQLHQVVMNLCLNAANAMDNSGEVDIRLEAVPADQNSFEPDTSLICISVSDTGTGMAPEVQARIFDPFFTTKSPDKGSGLGLSVVYGIVSQLGGRITVASTTSGPHSGTIFKIFLPVEC